MKSIDWASAVLSVVMALTVGVLGVFAAGWMVRQQIKSAPAQWHSLGTPPERAIGFVGLSPHVNDSRDVNVYVETVSGTVYRYACCSHPQAAWYKAQVTEELWPGLCDRDDPGEIIPRLALARLPAKVIACEEILWDKTPPDTSYFVLLDDHSVWWWREYVDLGMVVVWLLVGFGVGAGIGVWLSVMLRRSKMWVEWDMKRIAAIISSAVLACLVWGCSSRVQLGGVSEDPTYGYSEGNPIKVGGKKEHRGPENEHRYLEALRGPTGQKISYNRLGSCCPFDTPDGFLGGGLLDIYEVTYEGLKTPVKLYLNMYDRGRLLAPRGFSY